MPVMVALSLIVTSEVVCPMETGTPEVAVPSLRPLPVSVVSRLICPSPSMSMSAFPTPALVAAMVRVLSDALLAVMVRLEVSEESRERELASMVIAPLLRSISSALISTSVEDALPTVMVRAVALVPTLMAPVLASVPSPMVPELESMVTLPAGFRSTAFAPATENAPSAVLMVTWSRVVAPFTSRVPAIAVLPVVSATVNLSVSMVRPPLRATAPAMVIPVVVEVPSSHTACRFGAAPPLKVRSSSVPSSFLK